jgi:membrane-associated protease RseP (regulator of RpoE activity)
MIRREIAWRFALFGGLVVPALAPAQDTRPADPSAASPKEPTAAQVVTGPSGETVTINGSILIDPTAAVEPAEVDGDDPEQKAARARSGLFATSPRSVQTRTIFQAIPRSPDGLESRFGLGLAPVDDVLRSQLEIAKGQGVVVVEVKPGSLSEQAGLKPKDVLLSLGDNRVSGVGQVRDILLRLGKEALEVKLIREGKPRRMSLVGPQHGFTPDSSEFWIGVPVSPVDATLRSHLVELPAEAGLIANDVVKESPADKAGVKKYDILISLGGKPLKSPDTLIAQVQASGGKPVPLVYVRAGKPTTVEVTPTKRAHPTVISLNPGPRELQYRVLQPHMAIEVHKQIEDLIATRPPGATAAKPGEPGKDIQIELFTNKLKALNDDGDAKLAAQLKELTAKVDDLRKAIEGLKKSEGK